MIKLTGYIDIPEERHAEIAAALPIHIALTRAEPGCVKFEVVPDQNTRGRYLVSELFTTQDAFDAHQARVRASDWGRITAGIPREYKIETTED